MPVFLVKKNGSSISFTGFKFAHFNKEISNQHYNMLLTKKENT